MNFRTLIFSIWISIFALSCVSAQDNAEDEYTKVIRGRADKIVDAMTFEDDALKIQVRDLVMDHYRFLNVAEENRNADVNGIREQYAENKELRDAKIDLRKAEQEIAVRDHHFAFNAELNFLLSSEQVSQVKDGLTYNVMPNTYNAFLDMLPALTQEQKDQIYIWLVEAREHAIDGGSSKEKHGWFGKYKGRINNYLAKEGYDLKKESEAWEKRLKEQGVQL